MSRHLSPQEISECIAGERTAETAGHLAECPACAAEVADLTKSFALFRESGKRWSDHQYSLRRPRHSSNWWMAARIATAAAACAALCVAILRVPPSPPMARVQAEEPFLELPYVAPLAPYERSEVVREDLPVAALAAAGLEVHVPDTGATVLADVLLGQDGRAHAIRLVNNGSQMQ